MPTSTRTTSGLFFMRVEWMLEGFALDQFRAEFSRIADELKLRWRLALMAQRPRVAIFVSQYLHCLVDLLHRQQTGELNCVIPLIVSNHVEAAPLAQFYGAQFRHVPVNAEEKAAAEAEQLRLLRDAEIDLVVLARYMQILPRNSWRSTRSASSTCTIRFCRPSWAPNRTTRRLREA